MKLLKMSLLTSFLGFTYGWFLTWYSYDIDDISLIFRIFDFLISYNIINKCYAEIILASNLLIYLIKFLKEMKNITNDNIIISLYENKLKNVNKEEFIFLINKSNNIILMNYNKVEKVLMKKINLGERFLNLF